ncbi:MAG: alpha-glucosidase [Hyphomonas sp. BRH_c22]|uniref:alpha-amylase family glycosyl hydrolase n=1 Tax=Hyphomonas sp. BRH_c22 TaxID=1629710 RepID=UPI0005F17A17|nr:MAG: alpha-glucosidase [Hyphomonas sp. BRH_c22]
MTGSKNAQLASTGSTVPPWWRGAAIYQVYPRSYLDTNGDGVGDLPGITEKLGYISSLGVAGLWISPFFTSPMKDFGYDVSDYCGVDPIFGTLDDFDRLVEVAHAKGLRVIIDQVMSHTSDEHAWFGESRASRKNPKADWYVWQDARPDGSPPNNWQAVFVGAAWTWDARRQQYYMHNFLSSQPQLNLHNREVQDALLATSRFWLDRGVDGFRLDAINFSMFDPNFTDNPAREAGSRTITRPHDLQHHVHNQSHPDIPKFLERVRALTDEYGAVFTVAEVAGPDPLPEMKAFTAGDGRLNSAYSFDFLYASSLTPGRVRRAQSNWMDGFERGWPSWAFSNHDAPRCVSRWYDGSDRNRFARLTNALLLCLRGNPILYQGEELGLPQAEIAFEALQDPEAIANWPLTLGRDGARTPMPWVKDAAEAGFTTGRPWLPIGQGHADAAVDQQNDDARSVLNFTRKVLSIRRESPALMLGEIAFFDAQAPLLAFRRMSRDESVLCVFNLGGMPIQRPGYLPSGATALAESGWAENPSGSIPEYSVWIGRT